MLNHQSYVGERDLFTVAALSCATLSLASLCIVVPSLFFGSLGILFALLARRKNGKMTNESKLAIFFATGGLCIGLLLILAKLPQIWQIYTSDEYAQFVSRFQDVLGSVSGNSVSGAAP